MSSGISLKLLGADLSDEAWDEYVADQPSSSFFHQSAWRKVVERTYGHRCHYFAAMRGQEIRGLLPMGHIRSLLFGNSLISVPFGVYGGVLADDEETEQVLLEAACKLGRNLSVGCVELRHRTPHFDTLQSKALYYSFVKQISEADEENLSAIPRKQRAMVRKGIKAGLEAAVDADIERFAALYAESVRNLGTPVHRTSWFRNLKACFGDQCEILTVTHEAQPVCSVMSFYFRDQVLPYYGGGGDMARRLKGNDFMYWEVMRRAAALGCRTFDYGRSKEGTGSFSFKKNWGFEPTPLSYEFALIRSTEVPDVNPLNPKYRLFIEGWKRLPLSISRTLGPILARSLG